MNVRNPELINRLNYVGGINDYALAFSINGSDSVEDRFWYTLGHQAALAALASNKDFFDISRYSFVIGDTIFTEDSDEFRAAITWITLGGTYQNG